MKPTIKDITGQRFGSLVAIRATALRDEYSGAVIWECLCDCGSVAPYVSGKLINGTAKYCLTCSRAKFRAGRDKYKVPVKSGAWHATRTKNQAEARATATRLEAFSNRPFGKSTTTI